MWKYLSWPQACVLIAFFACVLLGWVSWTCYVVPKDKTCHEALMDRVGRCQDGGLAVDRVKCIETAKPLLEECSRIEGKRE